jgi:hypothetical protein
VRAAYVLGIAAACAAGTVLVGWGAVAVVALLAGAAAGAERAPRGASLVATGAVLGWGALLGAAAVRGPVGPLAARLGAVLGVPAIVLAAATLVFAALLAWSAAAVGEGVVRVVRSRAAPLARAARDG